MQKDLHGDNLFCGNPRREMFASGDFEVIRVRPAILAWCEVNDGGEQRLSASEKILHPPTPTGLPTKPWRGCYQKELIWSKDPGGEHQCHQKKYPTADMNLLPPGVKQKKDRTLDLARQRIQFETVHASYIRLSRGTQKAVTGVENQQDEDARWTAARRSTNTKPAAERNMEEREGRNNQRR